MTILLSGCLTAQKSDCPYFPEPSEALGKRLQALADKDPEMKEWGDKLLDLKSILGTKEDD